MKLDPLFSVKDNQLYTIAGDAKVELNFSDVNDISVPCELNQKTIYKILVDQKTIEPEAECYNEEYLASLRDFLKIMEENVETYMPGFTHLQKAKQFLTAQILLK